MKKTILHILLLLSFFTGRTQDNAKLSITALSGISLFPQNEETGKQGLPQNVFSGYKASILLGGGINYNFNKRISLVGICNYYNTSKKYYSLSSSALSIGLKYYFIPMNKIILPYLHANTGIALFTLKRDEHLINFNPPESYSISGPQDIHIDSVTYRQEYVKLSNYPAFKMGLGIGSEIKITDRISFYLEYSHNACLTKGIKDVKTYFTSNKSNLTYSSIVGGIKLNLVKSNEYHPRRQTRKSQYIVKRKVYKSAAKTRTSKNSDKPSDKQKDNITNKQNLEKNLIILGETNDQNIDSIYLYDSKKSVIAKARVDTSGVFVFKNLNSEEYVVKGKSKDDTISRLYFSYDNNENKIGKEKFNKAKSSSPDARKNNLSFNITGTLGDPSSQKLPTGTSIFIIGKNIGKVYKTLVNDIGNFNFQNVYEDEYIVIINNYNNYNTIKKSSTFKNIKVSISQ